jgi:UrcA family protein
MTGTHRRLDRAYSFRAIPRIFAVAHIRTVEQTSLFKETVMNKTLATAARTLTICIAATFGFNAANASTDDVANSLLVTTGLRTSTVRFADLDVSTLKGAKRLYTRLYMAALVVCKPLETAPLWHSDQYEVCLHKAVADAVASVNRPLLSQYHQSRTKGDKAGSVELAKAN